MNMLPPISFGEEFQFHNTGGHGLFGRQLDWCFNPETGMFSGQDKTGETTQNIDLNALVQDHFVNDGEGASKRQVIMLNSGETDNVCVTWHDDGDNIVESMEVTAVIRGRRDNHGHDYQNYQYINHRDGEWIFTNFL